MSGTKTPFVIRIETPCTVPDLERVITALMNREDSDDDLIVTTAGYGNIVIERQGPEEES